ncbi:MAG: hypothetical protein EON86_20245 [Brevundimonas sp.]|nr:MAG: hypothetical protein EON86_20245 [Brevundimonas sp.]
MKTPLMARAAALVLALAAATAPMAASAATADQNRPQQQQPHRDNDRRDNDRNDRNDRSDRNTNDRHGRWDNRWGARPPAPPRSFARAGDWNRHVRACQQRYRSYNPSTDRYTVRRGQTAVCRL